MAVDWQYLIREFRHRSKMNQHALAAMLGVSQSSVSQWERGVSDPPAGNHTALSKLFAELPAVDVRNSLINSVTNSPNMCALFSLTDGKCILEAVSSRRPGQFSPLTQDHIGQPLDGKLGEEINACMDELIKAGFFGGDIAHASSVAIAERDGLRTTAIATHTPFWTESGWLMRIEAGILTEEEAADILPTLPAISFIASDKPGFAHTLRIQFCGATESPAGGGPN